MAAVNYQVRANVVSCPAVLVNNLRRININQTAAVAGAAHNGQGRANAKGYLFMTPNEWANGWDLNNGTTYNFTFTEDAQGDLHISAQPQ